MCLKAVFSLDLLWPFKLAAIRENLESPLDLIVMTPLSIMAVPELLSPALSVQPRELASNVSTKLCAKEATATVTIMHIKRSA